ncbi:hypothetical protein KY312_02425 [Candidatus Woesearchaeota archaeon]|nr:hypothetical protein [Candidatus Woesearchaeota archaeon]
MAQKVDSASTPILVKSISPSQPKLLTSVPRIPSPFSATTPVENKAVKKTSSPNNLFLLGKFFKFSKFLKNFVFKDIQTPFLS